MPSQGVTNVANAIINKINNLISSHNSNNNAHQDIRNSIPKIFYAACDCSEQNQIIELECEDWNTEQGNIIYVRFNNVYIHDSTDVMFLNINEESIPVHHRIDFYNITPLTLFRDSVVKFTCYFIDENTPIFLYEFSTLTSELYNDIGFITSSSVPSASSATPLSDTQNGGVGTGTTWARSDHTHPKSNIYAEASHTHPQYLTSHQDITGKEDKSNKVTSLSSSSTDTQYPSAKAVFNLKEELDDKFENCMKNTDFFDMLDCINVNFNNLDNIYLLDTVFNISNYNGLPSKNSSVVNDILRNNAVSQISLNKEFTPSTKYTLEFDYYTSEGIRNGFYFGADPSLEDGVSITNSDDGLQVLVDISNTYVETFNGTSSPTNVYTHTSNLFSSGTHYIRIVRNNTNVVFYINGVKLYTYTNAKYNTIGLNKWTGGYNTISNIEIKIGD